MSTVNAPFLERIHYAEALAGVPEAVPSTGLCGARLLSARVQSTSDDSKVTCTECNVRILALLQARQNVIIQNIARFLNKV